MFKTLLFVGYLRRISNILEIITLSDLTHIGDPVAIDVKAIKIDDMCSLEIEFIELIHMNA